MWIADVLKFSEKMLAREHCAYKLAVNRHGVTDTEIENIEKKIYYHNTICKALKKIMGGQSMKHFVDNSVAPIVAFDFDGTICVGEDAYPDPHNGEVREYAKDVINFLYDIGVKIVIWTNRKNVPGTDIKDKLLMKQWLDDMGIKYSAVNTSTEFAPYKYYGRKMYAHMFVDDRGFGWYESADIMIDVLGAFLNSVLGCPDDVVRSICDDIAAYRVTNMIDTQYVKDAVANWNK